MLFYIYPLQSTFNSRDTPTRAAKIQPTIACIALTATSIEWLPTRTRKVPRSPYHRAPNPHMRITKKHIR